MPNIQSLKIAYTVNKVGIIINRKKFKISSITVFKLLATLSAIYLNI